MVSISKIIKQSISIGTDAFSHIQIKAPQSSPEGESKLAGEISKKASDAVSNYAQAIVQKRVKPDQFDEFGTLDRDFALRRIKHLIKKYTKKDDLISLDDAVKEIDVLPINDDAKLKILRGCVFETGEKEAKVSKPAVYIAKYAILDNYYVVPNKFQTALRTAMDEKTMTFNLDLFYSLFSPYSGQWHILVDYNGLKPRIGNTANRYINMDYMCQISEAFDRVKKGKDFIVHVKTSDIFRPLDKFSQDLTKKFDELIGNGEDLPQDLIKSIKKALSEYNFDTSKIFKDHYGLLKDCKTLEEVKTFYPELKFPTEAPKHDPGQSKYYLFNRLALGDFEASVIEGLQKLYTELQPYNMAYVSIKGSTATNIANLNKAGFKFGRPSDNLLAFFDECKKTEILLDKISRMDKEKLGPLIERHALRTSGVWKDFEGLTKTGKWLPIKLIRNKRAYPETTKYSTEKLVDTYLFNLFLRNPYQRYSANPLCRFDKISYLDDTSRNILNRTYMIRLLTKEADLPANITWKEFVTKYRKDFEAFKMQFDLDALGKSIEHLEDVYHRHFYRNYWTNARMEILQKQVQASQDIAYEKVIWGEELRKKEVDIEKVKNMIQTEEGASSESATRLIDDKEFSNFKYRVLTIKDPLLREKFQSAINFGRESDESYFKVFNDILKESDLGKTIDETKAQALLNIHEKYMTEALEGSQNLTEAEFKEQFLSKYKTGSKIDYEKIVKDTNAESEYTKLSSELIDEDSTEFLTELERRYKDDYVGINEIMEEYLDTPDIFREKFRSIYVNSTQTCPNKVLKRELTTFLEKIKNWHFERDELINLDKEKLGQFDDNFSQYVALPRELKEKIWKLSAQNYEICDELLTKFYNNAKRRTGESRGTGLKTLSQTGKKSLPPELKILGKHGGWRLYSRKATPEDIEKYGKVKYVFYDVVKTH